MVTLGDACVWHTPFMPGLCHFVDNLVVPSIDLLIVSRRPRLINPPKEATVVVGAAIWCFCDCY